MAEGPSGVEDVLERGHSLGGRRSSQRDRPENASQAFRSRAGRSASADQDAGDHVAPGASPGGAGERTGGGGREGAGPGGRRRGFFCGAAGGGGGVWGGKKGGAATEGPPPQIYI